MAGFIAIGLSEIELWYSVRRQESKSEL